MSSCFKYPEAIALLRKLRDCPCCQGQGPVLMIHHLDGRIESSKPCKASPELLEKWKLFPRQAKALKDCNFNEKRRTANNILTHFIKKNQFHLGKKSQFFGKLK